LEIVYAENNGVRSAAGKFTSDKYSFKEGKIITETGHISHDESKWETTKIDIKPKSLSEFGEMYQWEVTENKYL